MFESVGRCELYDDCVLVVDFFFPFFLQDSYEGQQHIQLMRFADYFARAFSAVGAAQFPWSKILKESPVEKIIDVGPLY